MSGSEHLHDSAARAILEQIESLGYRLSVFRLGASLLGSPGRIEVHALCLITEQQRLVWASEEEIDPELRVACELAEQVGIDLEA